MNEENKKVAYPFPLKLVQFSNYFATVIAVLVAILYLVAPNTVIAEALGSQPSNRLASAALFLVIAGLIGFVTYTFRQRRSNAPAFYVVFNLITFALVAVIDHIENYAPTLSDDLFAYAVQAAITAYLLFSSQVNNYFNR
ncbi:MAG TPA: hypothetical protein VK983_01400 [Candidatus Limnocylindrales bacterium]|nr:hypothetical protein [Candidatus Limnocylindrales bacterium]